MNQVSPRNRISLIATALIFLTYAAARLIAAPPVLEKPRILDDTTAYTRISQEPVNQIDFWAASRPPLFPLILKLADQDYSRAAAFQLGISIVAWGLLALAVCSFLRFAWLQPAGLGLILLFSLDRHIAAWDFVMLTESLSISCLALFVAAGLWLLKGWRVERAVVFALTALLLAFTRDTNAWMLLGLAALILVALLVHWLDHKAWILVFVLAAVFGLSDLSANMGERWLFPLGNLITRRVLPDASALTYFQTCGMPVSPPLLELSGKFANSNDQAMFSGPDLDAFRHWLHDEGKGCYVRWLITNPVASIRAVLYESAGLVAFPTVDQFFSNRYMPLLPGALGAVLYPERFTLWIWVCSSLAALAAIWRRSWADNRLWAAFVCLNLLIFPHLFLTWHGDAMAPDRHALSVGVQFYLAFWVLILLLAQHPWFRGQRTASS